MRRSSEPDPVVRANAAVTGIPAADKQAPVSAPRHGVHVARHHAGQRHHGRHFRYFFLGYLPGVSSPTTLSSTAVMGCN